MSAELFDGESAGALALPAVDILPAKPARKGRGGGQVEPSAPPLLEASEQGWATPAPHAPVNPWTGAPAPDASVPPVAAVAPVDATLAGYPPPGATTAPVQAPMPAPAGPSLDQMPVELPAQLAAPAPEAAPALPSAAQESDAPLEPVNTAPKKFFGMTVRRPKKSAPAADAPVDPMPEAYEAAVQPPAPTSAYEAVVAPVAAWPTDVGVSAVAEAEPQQAAGAHAAPAAFAPIDLLAPVGADTAPVQAPVHVPVDVPFGVAVDAADQAPTQVLTPVPADVPVAQAAPEPAPTPVLQEPAVAPVDAAELASLRAQLAVIDGQRLAAENRADQAVAYAQQTQARLGQLESDGQARIQAAETKARSAANEAQDWQIRHREAEATIAELAQSVAGAEKRMSELRAEHDELAAALDVATAPDQHAPTT